MDKFVANTPNTNYVLRHEDFSLSYNPKTGVGNPIAELASRMTGAQNRLAETALRVDGIWYILNGDFREEYSEAYDKGLKAVMAVYYKNIAHRSEWSTDDPNTIDADFSVIH